MINLKKEDAVADSIKNILEKKELSPKQKQIAKMSPPADKIDAGDLAKLRAGHKPVKSEGMDEEIDPKNTTVDTLAGREKKSKNPFLSKKVFMDVPGDVKEEAEQIDELKKSTVKSYIAKKSEKLPGKDPKKDMKSMMSAHHRITGVKPTSESLTLKKFKELHEDHSIFDQMINEVLSKDASAGDWIHDFVHSDNPKFKGKSKEMRKKMALAAYYAKQRNEEVEQIDEGKMDHMSLSHLWHAHSKHAYSADQGYGLGSGNPHHNDHAATAIENHVRKHYGNKVADDMVAHSDHHVAHAEYVGGKEAENVAAAAEKLRKKHGIKGDLYGINEGMDESSNPFSPDYKSQMPSKPGEKAGFSSKKISTGTVFTKKFKKDDEEEKKK